MGIDGYSFFERLPIQVKRSEHVGRNVVDNFETAIERDGKHKGYLVAFSFTSGAVEEAARARRKRGVEVVLVKVEDVVRLGELIDAATREGRPPVAPGETSDLIGLFRDLQQAAARHRESYIGAPEPAGRKRREPQQRFPVG